MARATSPRSTTPAVAAPEAVDAAAAPAGLRFSKMHGAGNDFVVLDLRNGAPPPDPARCRLIADRHRGVGCDQILTIAAPRTPGAVAAYGIWNADGSPSRQCGNGARCVAAWLVRDGAASGEFVLDSPADSHRVRALEDGGFEVAMGVPRFAPDAIPLAGVPAEAPLYPVEVDGRVLALGAVSMGNPHAVLLVDSVDDADVGILGAALETHPDFPRGVNVGFLEIVRPDRVRLRVFERGVGETPACGTGAAAAVAVGRRWGALDEEVDVELRGGVLTVRWPGPGQPLWQTGPTTLVYEGVIEL